VWGCACKKRCDVLRVYPTKLHLASDSLLEIQWSDGQRRQYTVRQLRDNCPCATCREKRQQPETPVLLPVLSPAETQPLKVAGMNPVGNYAYSIHFSDGHHTGIYTLEQLRELGEEAPVGRASSES
jgi:DUF971 family protein